MGYFLHSNSGDTVRWGGLATVLWGVLVSAVYVVVQSYAYISAVRFLNPDASEYEQKYLVAGSGSNGLVIALAIIGSTLLVLPLLLFIIKLKKGATFTDYLATRLVSVKIIVKWMLIALAIGVLFDVAKWLLDMPFITEFAIKTYVSRGNAWLFFPAVILFAPLIEEVFFRGFLFSGLERTWVKPMGAVVITSALWAVVHSQYEIFNIVSIFVFGCVLGVSRLATGSILPALITHIVVNSVAYIVVAIHIEQYFA